MQSGMGAWVNLKPASCSRNAHRVSFASHDPPPPLLFPFPAFPSVCDLDRLRGRQVRKGRRIRAGREREEVYTSLLYCRQPGPELATVLHRDTRALVQRTKESCSYSFLQPGDTKIRRISTQLANRRKWLLNLCTASVFSAFSLGLSVQLLPPGLEKRNRKC